MSRYARFRHQPVLPLGKDGRLITGCAAHRKLSRTIASEGTVLLKNDGILPLMQGTKLCPFGTGFSSFLFGGGGSAWVEANGNISLSDALRCNQQLEVFLPLLDYYNGFQKDLPDLSEPRNYSFTSVVTLPEIPESLYAQAKAFGGIALFAISRFSGENNWADRSGHDGGFQLTKDETALFDRLCNDFDKIIVILNACGPVSTHRFHDNPKVAAILYPMFSGSDAGAVICDLLLGKCYPSGHLQDTFADFIEDYPFFANFAQHWEYVDYEEDIFVGYRYFETFAPQKAIFPYGFGLSYTNFNITCEKAVRTTNTVKLTVRVTNTGKFPGKEVVQVYLAAPQGKLGKAAKVLTAFQKTKELLPGQSCEVKLSFDIRDFASFDDTGKIQKSAFVLEKGEYAVKLGVNVRDCETVLTFLLDKDILCKQCHSYMAPEKLQKRLTADGHYEPLPAPQSHPQPVSTYTVTVEPEYITLDDALAQNKIDALLASLSNTQLGDLLHGHPIPNASAAGGIGASIAVRLPNPRIPLVPTADGSAGYRASANAGVYSTFFPCATALAQTWNLKLAEKMGAASALEMKENNAGIWLSPAMNIHRGPLCSRNFEYFSEDPLCSGLFAAALVKGTQSQNVAATIKHFCCNNREANRKDVDSRVSERALREIYLRGFEIAIQKAKPWAVMTAYNLVNGQRSSTNWDAMEGILRQEWNYDGLIMTDWNVYSAIDDEIHAGSDVKMPYPVSETPAQTDWHAYAANGKTPLPDVEPLNPFDFDKAIADGSLTREQLLYHAKKVLEFLDHFE